jgi:hypothetical protein
MQTVTIKTNFKVKKRHWSLLVETLAEGVTALHEHPFIPPGLLRTPSLSL